MISISLDDLATSADIRDRIFLFPSGDSFAERESVSTTLDSMASLRGSVCH